MRSLSPSKMMAMAMVAMLVAARGANARITHYDVVRDDRSLILLREPFGFAPGGLVEITLKEPRVYLPEHAAPPDKTKFGFFLTAGRDEGALDAALADGACVLDVDFVQQTFTFADMDAQLKAGEREVSTYEFTQDITNGGDYMLFFANCEPHTVVSFGITTTFANKDSSGRLDYLGRGEKSLPSVYYLFFLLDVCAAAAWAYT